MNYESQIAFEDAIPDAWGRAILVRAYGLKHEQQESAQGLLFMAAAIIIR